MKREFPQTHGIADEIEKLSHAMTAGQLAEMLRVSKMTIYRLARAGILPSFRIGYSIRFDPKSVVRSLREVVCSLQPSS